MVRPRQHSASQCIRDWKRKYEVIKNEKWLKARGLWSHQRAYCGNNGRWNNVMPHYLGGMDSLCVKGCGAFHFAGESLARKCCDNGAGPFDGLAPLPNEFMNFLSNAEFRGSIRSYNNTFAMATLGVTAGSNILRSNDYPYYVKLAGGLYHSLPPLIESMPAFIIPSPIQIFA